MKKIILILFLLVFYHPVSIAEITKAQFEKINKLKGEYKVLKGSHKSCTNGMLNIVGVGKDQGIRIGHSIFLGPFIDSVEEPTSTNCRTSTQFKVVGESIILKTSVDKCNNDKNNEAGKSTQHLSFKDNIIEYKVDETGYVCRYRKKSKEKE